MKNQVKRTSLFIPCKKGIQLPLYETNGCLSKLPGGIKQGKKNEK